MSIASSTSWSIATCSRRPASNIAPYSSSPTSQSAGCGCTMPSIWNTATFHLRPLLATTPHIVATERHDEAPGLAINIPEAGKIAVGQSGVLGVWYEEGG